MIVAQEKPHYQSPPGKGCRPASKNRRNPLPRRGQLTMVGLVLLAFLVGIAVCYLHAQIMTTGDQIVTTQKKLDDLDVQTKELAGQVAELSSLQWIEKEATTRLGMVKPDNKHVVLIPASPKNPAVKPSAPASKTSVAAARPAAEHNWLLQALADLVGHHTDKVHPG